MSQAKRHSLLETFASTFIGYSVAFIANLIILPHFGFTPSVVENFWITNFFTVVSLVRGYFVRRLFNYLHIKGVLA